MLTIRDVQMEALAADTWARALARLGEHLRAACPRQTAGWDAQQLRQEVEHGVAQARRYGFEGERDIAIFLECRAELGEDFDAREDTAWMGEVLRDDTLFGAEKAELLTDRHLVAFAGGRP